MPRIQWPLVHGRPVLEVNLETALGGQRMSRRLLAETGAGGALSGFEILLKEQDCLACGGIPLPDVVLGGAYSGSYPLYLVQVSIPALLFDHAVPAVGVSRVPPGFDGIACFRFLNQFSYGNFGDLNQFALEILP